MTDEVVQRYTSLADQFGAKVEAAPDDAWSLPSPCEGWTARDIVTHVVGNQQYVVRGITGEDLAVDPVADPKAAWATAYGVMKETLARPGALDKTMQTPRGDMTVAELLGRLLSNDILVHTWDLSRTLGVDERLDPDAVAHAHEGLLPMDEMIRQPGVFAPKVEPAADADDQERFLNFLGRVTRP